MRRDVMAEFCKYIEDYPEEISVGRIASVLGISARTLRLRCKQAFSTSPKKVIMAHRMNRVRSVLLAPNDQTNITRVAIAHGFGDLGRFAGEYRNLFGETPSVTLRRARA